MQEVKAYPIGSKVYYFVPTWQGDLEIKESIVIGMFLHKTRGDLYYQLVNEAVEAYAVRLTKKGAEEQMEKYKEIREKLYAANDEHQKRMDELWGEDVYSDYSIDNLTKGETDESVSKVNE